MCTNGMNITQTSQCRLYFLVKVLAVLHVMHRGSEEGDDSLSRVLMTKNNMYDSTRETQRSSLRRAHFSWPNLPQDDNEDQS